MIFHAFFDLLNRYRKVAAAAWTKRTRPPDRSLDELAFLPAALELQDSPPHPAARVTLFCLMTFVVISVLWAALGKIDMVAVAPGKLIVPDRSKVVQPLETSVVKSIHVEEGKYVNEGDLLIELDPTITAADRKKIAAAGLDARLEFLRAQALLLALDNNQPPFSLQMLKTVMLKPWPNIKARSARCKACGKNSKPGS